MPIDLEENTITVDPDNVSLSRDSPNYKGHAIHSPKNGAEYAQYDRFENVSEIPTMGGASQFATKSPLLRECLAEFLGTFILVVFGDGAIAQVVLTDNMNGEYLSINIGWGLGVLFGIHCAGGISGAHLNPAVTSTMAMYGRLSWRKVPYYILAQLLGAFCAAVMVFCVYYPLLNKADPDRTITKGIFATYPNEDVSNGTAFLTEIFGTGLLLCGIFAIGDTSNKPASPYTTPSAVALLIVGIGMSFGANSGYALNPARDFGPRVLTAIAGWGGATFSSSGYYFWIPIVGPVIGGALGAGVYQLLIEMHHPNPKRSVGV